MIVPTPEICRAAYDLLSQTEPFCKWNLPDCDDVIFKVVGDKKAYGWYMRDGEKDVIAISYERCGQLSTVIATMAHEMIHLHAHVTCMETPSSFHNAAFKKLALKVSAIHGFDPKAF